MENQHSPCFLQSLSNGIDGISVFIGKLMGILTMVLVALIIFEIVMRYFLNSPTIWGTELQTFMYGAMCMLCIPYASYKNSHARVDILLKRLPRKVQLGLEIFYTIIFVFPFMAVLVWFESQVAYHSFTIREYSTLGAWQPALYPVKALIPLGAAFVLLQGVADLCKIILAYRKEGSHEL